MADEILDRRIALLKERDEVLTRIAWVMIVLTLPLYQADLADHPILSPSQYEVLTPIATMLTVIVIGSWASNKINLDSETRELQRKKQNEDQRT